MLGSSLIPHPPLRPDPTCASIATIMPNSLYNTEGLQITPKSRGEERTLCHPRPLSSRSSSPFSLSAPAATTPNPPRLRCPTNTPTPTSTPTATPEPPTPTPTATPVPTPTPTVDSHYPRLRLSHGFDGPRRCRLQRPASSSPSPTPTPGPAVDIMDTARSAMAEAVTFALEIDIVLDVRTGGLAIEVPGQVRGRPPRYRLQLRRPHHHHPLPGHRIEAHHIERHELHPRRHRQHVGTTSRRLSLLRRAERLPRIRTRATPQMSFLSEARPSTAWKLTSYRPRGPASRSAAQPATSTCSTGSESTTACCVKLRQAELVEFGEQGVPWPGLQHRKRQRDPDCPILRLRKIG